MQKERNALKLGIVTLVVVMLFFAVLLWISRQIGGQMKTIVIHFKPTPAMPSLVPGSTVVVGGQKVGQVIKAALIPINGSGTQNEKTPAYTVRVQAEIRQSLRLRSDCSAFADGPPLGGDGLIKIDPGVSMKPFSGEFIEGAEPAGFGAILASLHSEFNGDDPHSLLGQIKSQLDPQARRSLIGKLHQSLSDLNAMTAVLARELGPSDKATLLTGIEQIVENMNETTRLLRSELASDRPDVLLTKFHMAMDALNESLRTASRIIKNSETPVTNTLRSIEKTSGHIAAQTDPNRPDSLMAQLRRTSVSVNRALDSINEVTDATRKIVVLNHENVNRLLLNFKQASDHINTGVKYILRHPWQLLNAPSTTEIRQHAIFDAARSFSDAASRIDDATAQLRALSELDGGAIPLDDPELVRIRSELHETRKQYKKAEEALWRQLEVNK